MQLVLIINNYYVFCFMNLCTIHIWTKVIFAKALIIRLFLVYLLLAPTKTQPHTPLKHFILIRILSIKAIRANLLIEGLSHLILITATGKPRQTKILLHSVFRQQKYHHKLFLLQL